MTLDLRVSPKTVQKLAVEKLRSAILDGIFKPGERLVEADLCARLGVSRASLREALRSLEAERLIAIVPNKGPLVSSVSWDEAEEIYKVRALLEGEAAALFAARATPAQVEEMRAALADFTRAMDDPVTRLVATGQFYDIILSGCGNRIIHEVLKGLVARITFLRSRSMSQVGRAKQSAKEMRKILSAIEKGAAEEARSAAVDHVLRACAAARAVYTSQQTPPRSTSAR